MIRNKITYTQIVDILDHKNLYSPDNTITYVDSFKHLLKKQNVRSSQIEQIKTVKQYKQPVTSSIRRQSSRPGPPRRPGKPSVVRAWGCLHLPPHGAGQTILYKVNNLRLNKLK